ncbi:hypothetical protein Hbl1158_02965 [Halobaculum sp. CBA1158]|uniref:hypothetical protein n=1 Tax=Halobaculum sp. CBA1158 TaxID=2904243 RepID=UPI001F39BFB0|nr:hypothetical protein [Halobaculum sp. CBA1158]UIP00348.1 hypothetical protein Hbl1158_02965 [Halobaculum sp. CBA1158]
MSRNLPDRVAFPFGDVHLEGDVVDADPVGDIRLADVLLSVDVDGGTYRTLLSDAAPA